MGAAEAAADPADVAEFCSANGCASMAAGLIREKAPMSEVKKRVNSAGAIRELVLALSEIGREFVGERGGGGNCVLLGLLRGGDLECAGLLVGRDDHLAGQGCW